MNVDELPSGAQLVVIAEGSGAARVWRASLYVLADKHVVPRGHGPLTFATSSPDFGDLLPFVAKSYRECIAQMRGVPGVGSRWVHRRGGRVCVVDAVYEGSSETGGGMRVGYHYEQTAGQPPGRVRRARGTPPQTMALEEWRDLFTVEAPPPKQPKMRR